MNKLHSSKFFQFVTLIVISGMCMLLDTLTKIHFSSSTLPKNSPEYKAFGAEGNVYNKNGKLLYRVTSDVAWKYPLDEKIYLKHVTIYFYDKKTDMITYKVSSDDGWVEENKRLGMLGKNVVTTVTGANSGPDTILYGNQVHMDLNKNIFSSDENVKAVQGKSVVTGHGFSYNSDSQFLVLNSRVRVLYDK